MKLTRAELNRAVDTIRLSRRHHNTLLRILRDKYKAEKYLGATQAYWDTRAGKKFKRDRYALVALMRALGMKEVNS